MERIELVIDATQRFYNDLKDDPHARYRSWEHCYLSFYKARKKQEVDEDYLSLQLSFYLASWGMYRGSSFLLQKDYKIHIPVVKEILDSKYDSLSGITCCDLKKEYNQERLKELSAFIKDYHYKVRKSVKAQEIKNDISDTLITKILMGTLGCVPAYDRYFTDGLKLYNRVTNNKNLSATFNEKGFNKLIEFCKNYEKELNKLDLRLKIDKTIKYPLMKKIDMYFWNLGRPWAIEDNEGWKIGSKTVDYGNQYINYLQGETPNCFETYIIDSNNPKKG